MNDPHCAINNFTTASTGSQRCVHQAHGLIIRSQLPLLGLPLADGFAEDGLDLRSLPSGAVPMDPPRGELLLTEADGSTRYAAAFDGRMHRLRFPGCCEFVIDADLLTAGCRTDPSADPELASILASGALMSFVLSMRGATVLHASAVEVDGAAIGIVGASGFGKSTVAALLCAGGCALVSDDVLRVESDDRVWVHAGASELRLRAGVRSLAEAFAQPVRARDTADGRLALQPPRTSHDRLPLAGLVIPHVARPRTDVSVRRLPSADALVALLAFPRLLGWVSREVLRTQFEALATLAERVPVVAVHVPSGPPFTAEDGQRLRAALTTHLASSRAAVEAPH